MPSPACLLSVTPSPSPPAPHCHVPCTRGEAQPPPPLFPAPHARSGHRLATPLVPPRSPARVLPRARMVTHRPGLATPSPPTAYAAARLAHALASRARARTALRARTCPAPPPHLPAPPLAALAPPCYCCPAVRAHDAAPAYRCYVRGRRCPSPAAALLRPSRRTPPLVARPPASLWPRPAAPLRATARCARDPPPVRAPGPMTAGAHPRMF
nr:atherin-like [Aegilops tauschii subsp. strangulata]